jgi:hypothetical protein
MRRHKPQKQKQQPAPAPRRENTHSDHTPGIRKMEDEVGLVVSKFTGLGLPKAIVIKALLELANELCELAVANDEDLSILEGLL